MTALRGWLKTNGAEVALVVSLLQAVATAVVFLAAQQGYLFASPAERTTKLERLSDTLRDADLPQRMLALEAFADSARFQVGTLERQLDNLARFNCYKDPSTATLAGLPCSRLLNGRM